MVGLLYVNKLGVLGNVCEPIGAYRRMDLTRHTVALDEHGECFEVEIKGVEAHIKHELTAVFPEGYLRS